MPISIQTGGGAFDQKSSWLLHQHWRLNGNLALTAMFFLICIFPIKTIVFYFKILNYYITLDWVLFYQIFDKCSCNTGFLVTNWIKKQQQQQKQDRKMTTWQIPGWVVNSVYISRNFNYTCRFFASLASVYTQINFSITITSTFTGFFSKLEYI